MAKERIHPRQLDGFLAQRIGRPRDVLLALDRPTGMLETVIETEADYRAHALRLLGPSGQLRERVERPPAYVSDGRWVIDCACGAGAAAWPEKGIAICCECGNVYHPAFPLDWKAGEAALLVRDSQHQRHWFPDDSLAAARGLMQAESVADIKIETAARRGIRRR